MADWRIHAIPRPVRPLPNWLRFRLFFRPETRQTKLRQRLVILAAPAVFLLLWSAGFAIAKIGLQHAGPFTLLALRYVTVVMVLLPLLAILRPALPKGRAAWGMAVTGFLIQVGYFGFCCIAFKSGVSAGGVAIVVGLQPILVSLIAPRLVGESVSTLRWLGIALGLGRAVSVILARSGIATEPPLGLLAAVGGLIGITAAKLYEKRFGVTTDPVPANLIQYAFALPLALAVEGMQADWTPQLFFTLAYLVIGNSLVAITLLLAMIRAGEVARVSALFDLVPPLSALFARPLLGETMPPLAWAGMALAAAGVILVRRA